VRFRGREIKGANEDGRYDDFQLAVIHFLSKASRRDSIQQNSALASRRRSPLFGVEAAKRGNGEIFWRENSANSPQKSGISPQFTTTPDRGHYDARDPKQTKL
jgi:hypothetical protein